MEKSQRKAIGMRNKVLSYKGDRRHPSRGDANLTHTTKPTGVGGRTEAIDAAGEVFDF
jgi:hypothetical protein